VFIFTKWEQSKNKQSLNPCKTINNTAWLLG
jgi:hypothetical protein